jgi:hypothetical protein
MSADILVLTLLLRGADVEVEVEVECAPGAGLSELNREWGRAGDDSGELGRSSGDESASSSMELSPASAVYGNNGRPGPGSARCLPLSRVTLGGDTGRDKTAVAGTVGVLGEHGLAPPVPDMDGELGNAPGVPGVCVPGAGGGGGLGEVGAAAAVPGSACARAGERFIPPCSILRAGERRRRMSIQEREE